MARRQHLTDAQIVDACHRIAARDEQLRKAAIEIRADRVRKAALSRTDDAQRDHRLSNDIEI